MGQRNSFGCRTTTISAISSNGIHSSDSVSTASRNGTIPASVSSRTGIRRAAACRSRYGLRICDCALSDGLVSASEVSALLFPRLARQRVTVRVGVGTIKLQSSGFEIELQLVEEILIGSKAANKQVDLSSVSKWFSRLGKYS